MGRDAAGGWGAPVQRVERNPSDSERGRPITLQGQAAAAYAFHLQ